MAGAAQPFRIGAPAAASLLVNALLIAALLNLGMGDVGRQTDSAAMTVLSLASLKGVEEGVKEAETVASSTATAASQPPTDPPLVQPTVAIPSIAPQLVAVPVRLPLPMAVQPVGTQASHAAPTASPPDHQVTAAAASPPAVSQARHGAEDGLNIKAPPGASDSYAAKVRSWLYAHKLYPRSARMRREQGLVQVRFVLDRSGMLLEGAIITGSGHVSLDEEAEAMLCRAVPYPRAPAKLPGERIEFTVPIAFSLPA